MGAARAQAPVRLNKFLDACTCGRADKAALNALKKQLESRDSSIESLEEEIRRKDLEKDNLIVMQRELQSQIEEIRTLLNAHAGIAGMTDDKAAAIMQRRTRGINSRKRVATIKNLKAQEEKSVVALQSRARGLRGRRSVAARKSSKSLPGQDRLDREAEQTPHVVKLQARARGKSQRRMVAEKASVGVLPGQIRVNGPPAGAYGYSEGGSSYFDENESVDSDYDYEDGAFEGLGLELLAGKLKLAKVYGQEEPPAAEEELEWEVRYFVLYDSGRIIHHDDLVDGIPVGDRGLIELPSIRAVEKVLGVPTFVMKGASKVYLFKLEPHDEVMMRTWIGAISQELARVNKPEV